MYNLYTHTCGAVFRINMYDVLIMIRKFLENSNKEVYFSGFM